MCCAVGTKHKLCYLFWFAAGTASNARIRDSRIHFLFDASIRLSNEYLSELYISYKSLRQKESIDNFYIRSFLPNSKRFYGRSFGDAGAIVASPVWLGASSENL
jgi:hypothetical protein